MTETKLTGTVNKVDKSIDRLKTCPLLLRVFCNENRHHLPREYEQGHAPENELQIYTWMDATLGELSQLIKEVNPNARRRGTQFSFAIVTADNARNRYYLTNIGRTENGQRRADDHIQLAAKQYHIGDCLDVAIIMNRSEQTSTNQRRDRTSQKLPEDNHKRRYGSDRNPSGPVRSAPRNDHRDQPY